MKHFVELRTPELVTMVLQAFLLAFLVNCVWSKQTETNAMDGTKVNTRLLDHSNNTFTTKDTVKEHRSIDILADHWYNDYKSGIPNSQISNISGQFPTKHVFQTPTWQHTNTLSVEYRDTIVSTTPKSIFSGHVSPLIEQSGDSLITEKSINKPLTETATKERGINAPKTEGINDLTMPGDINDRPIEEHSGNTLMKKISVDAPMKVTTANTFLKEPSSDTYIMESTIDKHLKNDNRNTPIAVTAIDAHVKKDRSDDTQHNLISFRNAVDTRSPNNDPGVSITRTGQNTREILTFSTRSTHLSDAPKTAESSGEFDNKMRSESRRQGHDSVGESTSSSLVQAERETMESLVVTTRNRMWESILHGFVIQGVHATSSLDPVYLQRDDNMSGDIDSSYSYVQSATKSPPELMSTSQEPPSLTPLAIVLTSPRSTYSNISVQTLASRAFPFTVSNTTVPSTVSNTIVPSTVSNTTVPSTVSNTTVPSTVSNTMVPSTVSNPTVPSTVSNTMVPSTVSNTTVPSTVSNTTVPSTVSNTMVPSTVSNTTVPSTVSNTMVPSTVSNTTVPSTVSNTTVPSGASNTEVPSTVSNTTFDSTVSNTIVSSTVSNTDVPSTVSNTTVSSTVSNTTVPSSASNTEVPSTVSNTTVSSTVSNTTVPSTASNTTVSSTVSKTTVPSTVSNTTVPSTASNTTNPSTLSNSTIPFIVRNSTVTSTVSNNTVPSTVSNTTVPSTASNTTVPSRASNTTIPFIVSNSTVTSTVSNNTVPSTARNTTVTSTVSNITVPSIVSNSTVTSTASNTTVRFIPKNITVPSNGGNESFYFTTKKSTVPFTVRSSTDPPTVRSSTTPFNDRIHVVPREIRIAWLAPLGWKEGFSAETTVNVLKQAIIASQRFLSHTAIRVKWYNTKCNAKAALTSAVDARQDFDPDLILGPPCSAGVTGTIVLDHNCDRLSNVWFLDMQPNGKFVDFVQVDITLSGGFLKTVGCFVSSLQMDNRLRATHQTSPPYTDSIFGAAVGSSIVFIVAVLVQITLRRYRRRRLLDSMLWQVKFEEVDCVTAILSDTVRASFRNLARRRNLNSKKISKSETTFNFIENSPRTHHLLDDEPMFGSVAYVRGSLVSVKRITRANISLTKELIQQLNKLMELKHQNITAFVGACADPGRFLLLWEYCPKGSLQDIILNHNIKLDKMFKFALCQDVAKGLEYIHKSSVNYHGNLKSSNCVVDSRWTCKLTDFGVPRLISAERASVSSDDNREGFWSAPEIIRADRDVDFQKADIFALGIIFKEVFTRSTSYSDCESLYPTDIVRRVMRPDANEVLILPELSEDISNNPELCQLIAECWADEPPVRPSATKILKSLNRLNPSK